MQLRHIFVNISSRNTTISWVQYRIRAGFVAKTDFGICLVNSSVMNAGKEGLSTENTLVQAN